MRHGVPLRDIRHGLIGQRLGKQPASRCHHSTPKEIRINRKSQACLPAYTTADRRAPNFFGKPSAMRRSLDCRGEKKCAKRRFLDLKNRRSRSCATGAYSMYVGMAHERDRRFLWLKSDGSSPTLTETRAPTAQRERSEVAYFPNSTKTSYTYALTYKIPNASPKGMHSHEQYKNVPNKNKRD